MLTHFTFFHLFCGYETTFWNVYKLIYNAWIGIQKGFSDYWVVISIPLLIKIKLFLKSKKLSRYIEVYQSALLTRGALLTRNDCTWIILCNNIIFVLFKLRTSFNNNPSYEHLYYPLFTSTQVNLPTTLVCL